MKDLGVKIYKKTHKKPSQECFNPDKYEKEGFYLTNDGVNDILVSVVSPKAYPLEENANTVTMIGFWEDIESLFIEKNTDVKSEEIPQVIIPIEKNVRKEFALDMLSIALHGKKL